MTTLYAILLSIAITFLSMASLAQQRQGILLDVHLGANHHTNSSSRAGMDEQYLAARTGFSAIFDNDVLGLHLGLDYAHGNAGSIHLRMLQPFLGLSRLFGRDAFHVRTSFGFGLNAVLSEHIEEFQYHVEANPGAGFLRIESSAGKRLSDRIYFNAGLYAAFPFGSQFNLVSSDSTSSQLFPRPPIEYGMSNRALGVFLRMQFRAK